jgi:hypothetical protein
MRDSNPFSTKYVRPQNNEFIFAGDDTLPGLVSRIGRERIGQIVGPHGSGKTTLLETLKPHLAAAGWSIVHHTLRDGDRHLPANDREQAKWDVHTLVIIDGFEQLPWCRRAVIIRRARRCGCGLLVTCHRGLNLPTIHMTVIHRELVHALVQRLTRWAPNPIASDVIDQAYQRHGANVRELLFDLYDAWNSRNEG